VHGIKEKGSGFLPTPTTMDHIDRKGMRPSRAATNRKTGYLSEMIKMFPTPTATERSGINPKTGKGGGLNHLITVKMYPTPRASAAMTEDMETIAKRNKYNSKLEEKVAMDMYPTPTTRDYKDSTLSNSYQNRNSDSLPIKMMKEGKPGGKLNPEFVEFLMGYPTNWTKIDPTE
jgi:DNA (cytosine-5)-methyltransferase 1